MNDEELAFTTYKLLKLRPPAKHKCGHHSWYVYTWGLDAKAYVRDWRVAGALMERSPLLLLRFLGETPDRMKDPRKVVETLVRTLADA